MRYRKPRVLVSCGFMLACFCLLGACVSPSTQTAENSKAVASHKTESRVPQVGRYTMAFDLFKRGTREHVHTMELWSCSGVIVASKTATDLKHGEHVRVWIGSVAHCGGGDDVQQILRNAAAAKMEAEKLSGPLDSEAKLTFSFYDKSGQRHSVESRGIGWDDLGGPFPGEVGFDLAGWMRLLAKLVTLGDDFSLYSLRVSRDTYPTEARLLESIKPASSLDKHTFARVHGRIGGELRVVGYPGSDPKTRQFTYHETLKQVGIGALYTDIRPTQACRYGGQHDHIEEGVSGGGCFMWIGFDERHQRWSVFDAAKDQKRIQDFRNLKLQLVGVLSSQLGMSVGPVAACAQLTVEKLRKLDPSIPLE